MPRHDRLLLSWSVAAAVLLAAALAAGARRAHAAEPREVESLIAQGMDLRRQGKDERALPFFQKAYSIEHTPRTAGQLGLCEMAIGYWLSSETHLTEALESPSHPWISKNQQPLTSALERVRKRIGEVVVSGSPAGARVTVNGQEAGTLPLTAPVRVSEGRVQVELSARGYLAGKKVFRLAGGERQEIAIKLTEAPPPADPAMDPAAVNPTAAAPPDPPARRRAAPPPDAPPVAPVEHPADSSAGSGRTLAYVTGAAAVAALVVAVVETIQWQKKQTEFDTHTGMPTPISPLTTCGEADPGRGASGCAEIYDAAKQAWRISLVAYGVGTLLAAGTVYLFATSGPGRSADRAGRQQSLRCLPSVAVSGVASVGIGCGLRF